MKIPSMTPKRLLLCVTLTAAALAYAGNPAPRWEVTTLAFNPNNSHLILALEKEHISVASGGMQSFLVEGNPPQSSWKKLPLPEKISTRTIRAIVPLKDGLYVFSQRLSGDADDLQACRYHEKSKKWDAPVTVGGCRVPLNIRAKDKNLAIECEGQSPFRIPLPAGIVLKSIQTSISELKAITREGVVTYDEMAQQLRRGSKPQPPAWITLESIVKQLHL